VKIYSGRAVDCVREDTQQACSGLCGMKIHIRRAVDCVREDTQ
jgi:hypothetical protein